jgi:hypothetical protein
MLSDLSLLIHTFNGYQWLWAESLQRWRMVYNEPIPFLWGTDIEGHEKHDFGKFEVKYSGPGSWSDRLVRLLSKVDTKYVLYAQEDHWPTEKPPDFRILMEIMDKYDLKRLQISPVTQYYTLFGHEIPLFFHYKSKYLVSHQPSIWDKEFFLKQISYNEDPWLNEYEGTKRFNFPDIQGKIAIYPRKWFHHACRRGELIPIS